MPLPRKVTGSNPETTVHTRFISFLLTLLSSLYSYDFSFLLRSILVYGTNYKLKFTKNNKAYERPLLADQPKILFKNTEKPISISIKFSCLRDLCSCRLSKKDRDVKLLNGHAMPPACPFKRRVKFCDSILLIQSSLAEIINNMHIGIQKDGIPLEKAFQCTKTYCDSQQYSREQFEVLLI